MEIIIKAGINEGKSVMALAIKKLLEDNGIQCTLIDEPLTDKAIQEKLNIGLSGIDLDLVTLRTCNEK